MVFCANTRLCEVLNFHLWIIQNKQGKVNGFDTQLFQRYFLLRTAWQFHNIISRNYFIFNTWRSQFREITFLITKNVYHNPISPFLSSKLLNLKVYPAYNLNTRLWYHYIYHLTWGVERCLVFVPGDDWFWFTVNFTVDCQRISLHQVLRLGFEFSHKWNGCKGEWKNIILGAHLSLCLVDTCRHLARHRY